MAGARLLALLLLGVAGVAAARPADQLIVARRLYNEGQLDEALAAAQQAASIPSQASSARLVMGRIHLERYRRDAAIPELDRARSDLRAVDSRVLDQRERMELQIGLAAVLYFEERYGAAAELLEPIIDTSAVMAPDAHERALEWWATALDRQAQDSSDRGAAFVRIVDRMEQELRRDPSSAAANYWLAAAARGTRDLDRAWSAALAAWIRATLGRDHGVALRADLERLVTEALIPERAARLPIRERRQAISSMTAEWEAFKKIW